MRITADRSRCIGAGLCVLTAPDVFEHDEQEGLVTVLDAEPAAESHDAVRLVRELCPSNAITVSVTTESA